jgi:ubiquinone/menaquinone biosynthesis C-methylase UbiE
MSETARLQAEYARRDGEIPAGRYAATNPAALFIRHAMERNLVEQLARADLLPLSERQVLDVGCARGRWLAELETFGAERERMAGIELEPDRAAEAQERLAPADIRQGNATALPWEDSSFDVVSQVMMFSSILDSGVRQAAAREMVRVLRPDGALLWYDFFVDNPLNRATRGVRKRELDALFPGFEIVRWRRTTLAPPLVRLLVPRLRGVATTLQGTRVLNTHAMAVLRRP